MTNANNGDHDYVQWMMFTGNLPYECLRKQAQLSLLDTGSVTKNIRLCEKFPRNYRMYGVASCMLLITLSLKASTWIRYNVLSFLKLMALNKKKKVEFCFNMAILYRTSVKMYEVLCACDCLIGEWEKVKQLRGPHKVQTSHQSTFS